MKKYEDHLDIKLLLLCLGGNEHSRSKRNGLPQLIALTHTCTFDAQKQKSLYSIIRNKRDSVHTGHRHALSIGSLKCMSEMHTHAEK